MGKEEKLMTFVDGNISCVGRSIALRVWMGEMITKTSGVERGWSLSVSGFQNTFCDPLR